MASAVRFSFLLAWSAGVLATREAVQDTHAVPWRKGLIVGTLAGRTLSSGNAMAMVPEQEVGHTGGDLKAGDAPLELDRRLELLLTSFLSDADSLQEDLVRRLVKSLLRHADQRGDLATTIEDSIRKAIDQHSVSSFWENLGPEGIVQEVTVPYGDGSQIIQLGRFRAAGHRDRLEVFGVQHTLWSMHWSNSIDGIFLHSIAQSHSPEELEVDTDTDVLMIVEPHIGALQTFVEDHNPGFMQTVRILVQLYYAIQRLDVKDVLHVSDINAQTVYIKGNVADPDTVKVALSPTIRLSELTLHTAGSLREDVQQLGRLLRFLFDRSWPNIVQTRVDALMAFGRALESGALPDGGLLIFKAFLDDVLSDETRPERLRQWRLEFLRRVVETEDELLALEDQLPAF